MFHDHYDDDDRQDSTATDMGQAAADFMWTPPYYTTYILPEDEDDGDEGPVASSTLKQRMRPVDT